MTDETDDAPGATPDDERPLADILEVDRIDADKVELRPRELVGGPEQEEIGALVGRDVVLDTRGELLYIGRLEAIGAYFYVLLDADVHDITQGRTSKEIYVLESFKYGVKKNRKRVYVRASEVVSLSALDDVIEY